MTKATIDQSRKRRSALRVSDAVATYLVNEARAELVVGMAQVHESPVAFAAAITKPRRRP